MIDKIQEIFKNLDQQKIQQYKDYWESLTPKTNEDYYRRWVFSFLSVHTSWKANVNSYLLLDQHANAWLHDKQELDKLLRRGACGLYERRREGLWVFKYLFWENPDSWRKQETENWQECRNRLQQRCNGLGYAKTAFALEMCYPTECESVCLDTHMLQLYGYASGKEQSKIGKGNKYIELENDWVGKAKEFKIPAYIARCLYWDGNQRQANSRYWSYVFEH